MSVSPHTPAHHARTEPISSHTVSPPQLLRSSSPDVDVEPCIQGSSDEEPDTSRDFGGEPGIQAGSGEEPDTDGDLDGEQCSMDGVIGDELATNSGESSTKVVGEYDTTENHDQDLCPKEDLSDSSGSKGDSSDSSGKSGLHFKILC